MTTHEPFTRDPEREIVDAARKAFPSTAHKVVPRYPTPEMLEAGREWSGLPASTWQNMWDAAPSAVQDAPPPREPDADWLAHLHRHDAVDYDGMLKDLTQIRADASVRMLNFDERELITRAVDELASRRAVADAPPPESRLQAEWKRECDDADKICAALGLSSDEARTDGGSLHLPRILGVIARLREKDA